ncbi:PQQ-binding-like beta-propeller repeat protein [Halomonas sp. DP1Y21-3]|uniref:outer membrane protein assembly factor BamB family protein n=1 Tax=Halomonas sp. DP1Y21-3 TaxID=2859080 RepID=UPI001C97B297|nr:PQQ-binding-like beta-propeller repeat protein [Halomonas sp. DP1Y21-3]MBY6110424.1 PQQ-binding-like beta-propeller repeat protein [Halomonas sp. DP1Y21-3]
MGKSVELARLEVKDAGGKAMDDRRAARWPARLLGLLVLATALVALAAGGYLLALGGSAYYVLAAGGLALTGCGLMARWRLAPGLYALLLGATLGWALWEVGLDAWRLLPRLGLPALLGLVLLLPWFARGAYACCRQALGLMTLSCLSLLLLLAFLPAVEPSLSSRPESSGSSVPKAPANPQGESATGLDALWRLELEQDRAEAEAEAEAEGETESHLATAFPLVIIDDRLIVCTSSGIEARMVATGERLWSHSNSDGHPNSDGKGNEDNIEPLGPCRTLAYHDAAERTQDMVEGVFAPTPGEGEPDPLEMSTTHEGAGEEGVAESDLVCPQRLFVVTRDRRLLALDADTGRHCESFGTDGQVDLAEVADVAEVAGMSADTSAEVLKGAAGIQVTSRLVLLTGFGPEVVALDIATGDRIWRWRPETPGTDNLRIVAVDETQGLLMVAAPAVPAVPAAPAAPAASGTERRPDNVRDESEQGPGGRVTALEVTTGEPLWTRALDLAPTPGEGAMPVDAAITASTAAKDVVMVSLDDRPQAAVVATSEGRLLMLDMPSGETLASLDLRPPPPLSAETWRTPPSDPKALRERDMWGLSPMDQLLCRIRLRARDSAGPVTLPASLERLIRPTLPLASPRVAMRLGPDGQALYASVGSRGADPRHPWLSCRTPPWGELVKVELSTLYALHGSDGSDGSDSSAIVWRRTVGDLDVELPQELRLPFELSLPVGTANLSTPMMLAGSSGDAAVVVAAQTRSVALYAFAQDDGRALWRQRMVEGARGASQLTHQGRSEANVVALVLPRDAASSDHAAELVVYAAPEALPQGAGAK